MTRSALFPCAPYVSTAYAQEEAVQEQYEKNRLATARDQRRRWRGHVVDNAKTIDRTYGRENFAVVRYGGAEAGSRSDTGPKAKAWCLPVNAETSLSLRVDSSTLSPLTPRAR